MVQENDINFHILANEVQDGIYVCDFDSKFIYANLILTDMFGFEKPSEIIGRNFEEFISSERRKEFMAQFRKSMESGANFQIITNEITRQDRKIVHIEVIPMPFIQNGILLGSQGVVHDITERKQAETKMMYATIHDSLTALYNRTFFEAEMQRLERGRQFPISIIVVNAEILTNANDVENHEVGDKLIKRMARLLFSAFRGDDIVARIGEDEFAILLPNVDENALEKTITRIRGKLQEIMIKENEPPLEFYFGSDTANEAGSLNPVLEQAESIAHLEKKKNKNI